MAFGVFASYFGSGGGAISERTLLRMQNLSYLLVQFQKYEVIK